MKVDDAPPPGWYPDPEGGSRLRWWEGTDWSDRYRPRPTSGGTPVPPPPVGGSPPGVPGVPGHLPAGTYGRAEVDQIVEQVRQAARSEAERAATMFGHQARSITSDIAPLITEYTNKFVRLLKIFAWIGILLLIGWIAFQIFAEVTLFDWIGDRIDNLTDNLGDSGAPPGPVGG